MMTIFMNLLQKYINNDNNKNDKDSFNVTLLPVPTQVIKYKSCRKYRFVCFMSWQRGMPRSSGVAADDLICRWKEVLQPPRSLRGEGQAYIPPEPGNLSLDVGVVPMELRRRKLCLETSHPLISCIL